MNKNNPYSILFQKEKANSPLKDLLVDFKMVCTSFQFKACGSPKELASNDWKDEDGNDTYYPDSIKLSGYDIEIGFAYKGSEKQALYYYDALRDYLRGADGYGVALKLYNAFTGIGRRHVYFSGVGKEPDYTCEFDNEILEFSLIFKVDDPNTNIYPNATLTQLI